MTHNVLVRHNYTNPRQILQTLLFWLAVLETIYGGTKGQLSLQSKGEGRELYSPL